MATNFLGYLIKQASTGYSAEFNNAWINFKTYKTTPNSREEIEAFRDDYTRALTRVTASGQVSSFEFETMPMDLEDFITMMTFFTQATTLAGQRKVKLKYWNMESFTYKTNEFYMPDIEYTIKKVYYTAKDMEIEPVRLAFIEYAPLSAT